MIKLYKNQQVIVDKEQTTQTLKKWGEERTGLLGSNKEFHWVWRRCIFSSTPQRPRSHSSDIPSSLLSSLPLVAVLQIRGELITWGYHANISNTARVPHILCVTLWFELLQTGLIQAASGQCTSLSHPNCGSREHIPTESHHAAVSNPISVKICLYTVCISHWLSALLKESNFALTQNSRSKRQSPDFMAFMGIRHGMQNKPPRGILPVRKEGDYSEPV